MINKIFPKLVSDLDFFEKGTVISYINVFNYLQFRKNTKLVNSIDKFTLDGVLLLIIVRILYNKKLKRLSPDFSSYFTELFDLCEKNNKKFFFIGASNNEMLLFKKLIKKKHPKLTVLGYNDGYFKESEEDELINKIIYLKPDILLIGLGTPKQEVVSIKIKKQGYKGTIYTCGAFISQTANKGIQYYPKFINKLHLRWFYRLITEKGLLKRYFFYYPYSVILILKDFIKLKQTK